MLVEGKLEVKYSSCYTCPMNVYPINNINFKANYYKTQNYGKATSTKVMTDNSENLGSKPVHINWNDQKTEMIFDGQFYTTKSFVLGDEYKILYEDTGLYENQGQERFLDKDRIFRAIKSLDKTSNRALMRGSAEGLLVQAKNIDEKLLESNTPLVIICEDAKDAYKYFEHFDKIEGVLLKSADEGVLSHFSALFRDYFSFGHLVTNEQTIEDLSKLEGEFVSISNENDELKYKEIAPITKVARAEEKVIIPQMKRVDKILTLDECEKDTVGNKAYNLKRMMNLVKERKLQDVIIPNAFVLPHAYLEHVEKTIAENRRNKYDKENKILLEIKDFAKDVITTDSIMIRSAFNGEDLDGYSAAGLYDSTWDFLKSFDLDKINYVLRSKDKLVASKSRERHGIKDEEIKPSVIIQDFIHSDYTFTTYTESPLDKDKLLIELFINRDLHCKPEPYQITFDRNTGNLAVEKEHSLLTEYVFDENYNLLSSKPLEESHVKELFPILKKLVKNALVLEKEFGKPQDIEGGIKAGQLYFWQARNIVKKAAKH